jgi:LPS-assembly lipoprotein
MRALLLSLVLMLAGCGFQPVYGTRAEGGLSNTLRQVEVLPVPGRVGQVFVAALEDRLDPQAEGSSKRYELKPSVTVQMVPVSIAPDGTVARFRVLYDTRFTLYDREAGKRVASDRIQRSGSYQVINDAEYSAYVAEQDAIARGLEELAQDYFLRISNVLKDYEAKQGQRV